MTSLSEKFSFLQLGLRALHLIELVKKSRFDESKKEHLYQFAEEFNNYFHLINSDLNNTVGEC